MLSHRPQTGQQASDEMSSEEVAKDLAFLDIMNYENTNYTKGLKKEHKGREKKNQNKATKAETVEYQTPKVAQKEDTTKGNKRRGQGGTAFRGVDPRRVGAASRFPAAQVHLRGDTQPAEEMVIHEREMTQRRAVDHHEQTYHFEKPPEPHVGTRTGSGAPKAMPQLRRWVPGTICDQLSPASHQNSVLGKMGAHVLEKDLRGS